jgi:broad specificity phosphatase PhoE
MARLVLVRHGRASAGWDDHPDPGLDGAGRAQAVAVADALAPTGARAIVTSPLRRCRETAAPLAARWAVEPVVDEAVAEIPSPEGYPLDNRAAWLLAAMAGTWSQLGERYTTWRDGVAERLLRVDVDTVVFSHLIAINVAIGAALGDDRLVIRRLDNCSRTVVDTDGDRLTLVETGPEAATTVL